MVDQKSDPYQAIGDKILLQKLSLNVLILLLVLVFHRPLIILVETVLQIMKDFCVQAAALTIQALVRSNAKNVLRKTKI